MKASGRRSADETLAAALASGKTIAEAATLAGVGETTVYRRLKERTFGDRVKELRGEMVGRAAGKLADTMAEAADVLRKLLSSSTESIQLRAADLLLGHGMKVTELAELQQQVEELQRILGAGKP